MDFILPPINYPIPSKKVALDLPDFELPDGFDNEKNYLEHLVFERAAELYGNPLPECVNTRLNFELEIIMGKGFSNYFLIIEDMVRIARNRYNLYVGPGRGSAAGSLVCFCLGITKIDPLKHDLLFERFINPDRNVLPDIDVDCEDGTRVVLIEYLKEKYGDSSVTNIIAYQRSKDKLRTITGYGVHACGIALSRLPISYYSPLTKIDNTVVTVYDGSNIEDAGPVKIDILDWDVMTKMNNILNLIRDTQHIEIEINSIPLDDQYTLEAFSHGETNNIDMFSSNRLKSVLKSFNNISFDDLVALHTMYRPGLIEYIPEYISKKNGKMPIEYKLPVMEKYLKQTSGLMLYQEQLMLLVRMVANFSRSEGDELRKALGKKKEDKLVIFHQKFIDGGKTNGYSDKILEDIWSDWYKQGLYLFNKSHAVCYTMIAYQMMYLKVHYPDEFAKITGLQQSNI